MTWTIDEARVMPFLEAAHRRDLLAALRRPAPAPVPAPAADEGTPGPHAKSFEDSKDGTDGAWTPTGPAAPLTARPAERTTTMPAGTDDGTGIGTDTDDSGDARTDARSDDVLSVLRASRASRFLRERGLVI
ncbi:hypothetical protein ACFY71_10010 [Streptomyces cinerochromogenes]|uniref:hypothetical protein n=1 Tax=Streptomyces cinerochromogenes TaxID=66422 RepID=UPI0036B29FAF